jgi:hypothetical protein
MRKRKAAPEVWELVWYSQHTVMLFCPTQTIPQNTNLIHCYLDGD